MSMYRFGDDYGLNYSPLDALDNPMEDGWGKVESVEIDGTVFVNADGNNRWHQLFGTPERAARTICRQLKHFNICICDGCPVKPPNKECDSEYDSLLEWMEGDAE